MRKRGREKTGFTENLFLTLFLRKLGLFSQSILSSMLSRKYYPNCPVNKARKRFFVTPVISLSLFFTQKWRAEHPSRHRPYLLCRGMV
jgi:hypothetical protein